MVTGSLTSGKGRLEMVAIGYQGGTDRRPTTLLDACLFWDRCQGGTIHTYLPRLRWERARGSCVRGMGSIPVWHLMLDGKAIGWTQCPASERPAITPSLDPNMLDYLPEGCEWM